MKAETTKVVPTYTKMAKKIAKAAWDASRTKKCRENRTRLVKKALKDFSDKMQGQALHIMMVLKSGYGVRSPEFKSAMKGFKELVKAVEHGCATANAWLELANADGK